MQEIYPGHEPVLLQESLELLNLKPGQIAIDCIAWTRRSLLRNLESHGTKGQLFAFERDERNLQVARSRLEKIGNNFTLFHDNFSSLTDRLRRKGYPKRMQFSLILDSLPHMWMKASRGFSLLRKDHSICALTLLRKNGCGPSQYT